MNYQAQMATLPTLSAPDAAKAAGDPYPEGMEYFAWAEVFGSTAGPFNGLGGMAISTFTMEAWVGLDKAVVFCRGRVVRVVGREVFDGWLLPNWQERKETR